MKLIVFKHKGDFNKTEKFLKKRFPGVDIIDKYARQGVSALSSATPVDTGKTSSSWGYKIERGKSGIKITWTNSNVVNGVPIAIILQYGHGTRNGGYVQGRDYINPTIRPIFDALANELWREVTNQ